MRSTRLPGKDRPRGRAGSSALPTSAWACSFAGASFHAGRMATQSRGHGTRRCDSRSHDLRRSAHVRSSALATSAGVPCPRLRGHALSRGLVFTRDAWPRKAVAMAHGIWHTASRQERHSQTGRLSATTWGTSGRHIEPCRPTLPRCAKAGCTWPCGRCARASRF